MRNKHIIKIFGVVLLSLVLLLFFIRLFSERQLDDLSPGIGCDEELIKKSDVLYVIPAFNGINISSNLEWCSYVLAFNKELAMHGVYHTYEEFDTYRNENYVDYGREVFKECFGVFPSRFKPPQIAWTEENDWMREKFEIDLEWNQFFHKTYHCSDTGTFPNWIVNLF
jgi:hypothetical protein